MEKHILFAMLFLGMSLCLSNPVYSWDSDLTHPSITENAVIASTADDYVKTQLGLSGGVTTQLEWTLADMFLYPRFQNIEPDQPVKSIIDWIMAGSIIEDY